MGDLRFKIAAVDAWNNKFEYVQVDKIFERKGKTKKAIRPKNKADFDINKTYAELLEECPENCSMKHQHKKSYGSIKIKFLGSKNFRICIAS